MQQWEVVAVEQEPGEAEGEEEEEVGLAWWDFKYLPKHTPLGCHHRLLSVYRLAASSALPTVRKK